MASFCHQPSSHWFMSHAQFNLAFLHLRHPRQVLVRVNSELAPHSSHIPWLSAGSTLQPQPTSSSASSGQPTRPDPPLCSLSSAPSSSATTLCALGISLFIVISLLLTFEPSIRDGAHYVIDRLSHPQLWKQIELHVIQADCLRPSLRLVHIGVEFESLNF